MKKNSEKVKTYMFLGFVLYLMWYDLIFLMSAKVIITDSGIAFACSWNVERNIYIKNNYLHGLCEKKAVRHTGKNYLEALHIDKKISKMKKGQRIKKRTYLFEMKMCLPIAGWQKL